MSELATPHLIATTALIAGKAMSEVIAGMAAESATVEGEKTRNISYVVHGAKIRCFSEGQVDQEGNPIPNSSRAGRLIVPLSHGVYLRKKAQLNKMDCKPIINVQSCGVCSSETQKNREKKEQEKKNKGIIEKVTSFVKSVAELFYVSKADKAKKEKLLDEIIAVCEPVIYDCWQDTKEDVFIEGEEALLNVSFLCCAKGGVIRIIEDGQMEEGELAQN